MMNKRFVTKIRSLIIITLFQLLVVTLLLVLLIIKFFTLELNLEIISWFLPVFFVLLFFLVFFMELRRLLWMLLKYKKSKKQVMKYLEKRIENHNKIKNINRQTFHFRIYIKYRLYEDALLALEKGRKKDH